MLYLNEKVNTLPNTLRTPHFFEHYQSNSETNDVILMDEKMMIENHPFIGCGYSNNTLKFYRFSLANLIITLEEFGENRKQ